MFNVLVVDDEKEIRDAIENIFKRRKLKYNKS